MSEEKELPPLELVHDFLIDQRVLNVVIDMASPKEGADTSGPEDYYESRLVLVAPMNHEYPPIKIAEVRVRKNYDEDGSHCAIFVKSSLLKLIDDLGYKLLNYDDCPEIALKLEDPESLDKLVVILGELVDNYNEFARMMNEVGIELLQSHLVWDNMRMRPIKLKR